MAEPRIVVEHREHLWYLLAEAAQVEHLIMCQYLYAELQPEGRPGRRADRGTGRRGRPVARGTAGIAVEEMLHLALVFNLMTAIGAAAAGHDRTSRALSDDLPGRRPVRLLPFGTTR